MANINRVGSYLDNKLYAPLPQKAKYVQNFICFFLSTRKACTSRRPSYILVWIKIVESFFRFCKEPENSSLFISNLPQVPGLNKSGGTGLSYLQLEEQLLASFSDGQITILNLDGCIQHSAQVC